MLLGVDVKGILGSVLSKDAQPATLIKIVPGTRTPGSISAGTNPTSTSFSCRGWIEVWTDTDVAGTLIEQGDRKITLIASTLAATPTTNDQITIVDLDGVSKTFRIEGDVIGSGPNGAFYICQARL